MSENTNYDRSPRNRADAPPPGTISSFPVGCARPRARSRQTPGIRAQKCLSELSETGGAESVSTPRPALMRRYPNPPPPSGRSPRARVPRSMNPRRVWEKLPAQEVEIEVAARWGLGQYPYSDLEPKRTLNFLSPGACSIARPECRCAEGPGSTSGGSRHPGFGPASHSANDLALCLSGSPPRRAPRQDPPASGPPRAFDIT